MQSALEKTWKWDLCPNRMYYQCFNGTNYWSKLRTTLYLLTKEFIWRGKQLILNCRMDHGDSQTYGDLRVEIVKRPDDTNPARRTGEVVPGYIFDYCDPIRSNCSNQVVTWHSSDDIGLLDGQPIYLRFRIRNGRLFSFMMQK